MDKYRTVVFISCVHTQTLHARSCRVPKNQTRDTNVQCMFIASMPLISQPYQYSSNIGLYLQISFPMSKCVHTEIITDCDFKLSRRLITKDRLSYVFGPVRVCSHNNTHTACTQTALPNSPGEIVSESKQKIYEESQSPCLYMSA